MSKDKKKWELSINKEEKRIYLVCPKGICRSYNDYKSPKHIDSIYSKMEENRDYANTLISIQKTLDEASDYLTGKHN